MRICNKCLQEKELNYFRKRTYKNKKIYFVSFCRACEKIVNRLYDASRKQKKKIYDAARRPKKYNLSPEERAQRRKEYLKQYRKTHKPSKDKKKQYNQNYYLKNKELILIKDRLRNKKIIRKLQNNKRIKNKKQKDILFRIRMNFSSKIANYIKINKDISKILYYNVKTLKEHLEKQFEPWMTWENWGKYNPQTWNDQDSSTWKWQIDHIIPHSTFQYKSIEDEEFKKCWSLDNLRPYSAKLNIIDGSRRVRHKK